MMRRIVVIVLATLVLMPALVSAQATPEASPAAEPPYDTMNAMMPSAEQLGEGWSLAGTREGYREASNTERIVHVLLGPNGAQVSIGLYALSPTLSDKSQQWGDLLDLWQAWADSYANRYKGESEQRSVSRDLHASEPLPLGATDAVRYETVDEGWFQPVGNSIYVIGTDGTEYALFVTLVGDVLGEHGVAGTDAVADLVASAMPAGG